MRCPFCSHDETQVVETRESDEGDVVRRRRRCHKCDKRFTTYERAEIALPSVVKKDGTREDFGATCKVEMGEGDVFVIETPGGGGYGK